MSGKEKNLKRNRKESPNAGFSKQDKASEFNLNESNENSSHNPQRRGAKVRRRIIMNVTESNSSGKLQEVTETEKVSKGVKPKLDGNLSSSMTIQKVTRVTRSRSANQKVVRINPNNKSRNRSGRNNNNVTVDRTIGEGRELDQASANKVADAWILQGPLPKECPKTAI